MKIEVDQSIRIEDPGDTFLAYANGCTYTIRIPFSVKRSCLQLLYARRKTRMRSKLLLFAACVYLLVKDDIQNITTIIVDNEYDGHGSDIRGFLYEYLKRAGYDFSIKNVVIDSIGKKSRAHEYAWGAQAGKKVINRVIKFRELMEVIA